MGISGFRTISCHCIMPLYGLTIRYHASNTIVIEVASNTIVIEVAPKSKIKEKSQTAKKRGKLRICMFAIFVSISCTKYV